jgi:hypothetical protein
MSFQGKQPNRRRVVDTETLRLRRDAPVSLLDEIRVGIRRSELELLQGHVRLRCGWGCQRRRAQNGQEGIKPTGTRIPLANLKLSDTWPRGNLGPASPHVITQTGDELYARRTSRKRGTFLRYAARRRALMTASCRLGGAADARGGARDTDAGGQEDPKEVGLPARARLDEEQPGRDGVEGRWRPSAPHPREPAPQSPAAIYSPSKLEILRSHRP